MLTIPKTNLEGLWGSVSFLSSNSPVTSARVVAVAMAGSECLFSTERCWAALLEPSREESSSASPSVLPVLGVGGGLLVGELLMLRNLSFNLLDKLERATNLELVGGFPDAP